jgi:hypothetical protein
MLEKSEPTCVWCAHSRVHDTTTSHVMFFCPNIGTDYRSFKDTLRSQWLQPGLWCYICMVPRVLPDMHHHPVYHPDIYPVACTYPDAIKPTAYYIYKKPSVRAAVFARLAMKFDVFAGITEYCQWLVEQSGRGFLNIHEAFITFWALRDSGLL